MTDLPKYQFDHAKLVQQLGQFQFETGDNNKITQSILAFFLSTTAKPLLESTNDDSIELKPQLSKPFKPLLNTYSVSIHGVKDIDDPIDVFIEAKNKEQAEIKANTGLKMGEWASVSLYSKG